MGQATFQIWRGDQSGGQLREYRAEVGEGMVVLDCVHQIQATQAPDLACRWNCKAGKCGSCSAEINGKPRLMCMTRMDDERFINAAEPITLQPMKAFPIVKDLVTDVSWNYKINKMIPPFTPRPPEAADGTWRMSQEEVDRIQEFRKCIECFLCQNVCHVLRDHHMTGEPETSGERGAGPGVPDRASAAREIFGGPRFMIRVAGLDMHPLDTVDRLKMVRDDLNIGLCNITKCCTEVCPEHIHITDNGIIPLKERVVDQYYDPVLWLARKIGGLFGLGKQTRKSLPMVSK